MKSCLSACKEPARLLYAEGFLKNDVIFIIPAASFCLVAALASALIACALFLAISLGSRRAFLLSGIGRFGLLCVLACRMPS